jgi:hypothetical protein
MKTNQRKKVGKLTLKLISGSTLQVSKSANKVNAAMLNGVLKIFF